MSTIPFGGPGEIPPVTVRCQTDEFENCIRRFGVVSACEWFGHATDSSFTAETIEHLIQRSEIDNASNG